MELYLDSANLKEIKEGFDLGFLYGLTTTPTFMHREGITDVDQTILDLAKIVPVLQIEALGKTSDEIVDEAHRLLDLGLDKDKTVFKIPISLVGAQACNRLVKEGLMVNLHLIYTVQQAYIAMNAGATYICPLVGRLQDQGHDALQVIAQCVDAVENYGYNSKIMFSSVRHPEHVRNALNIGAHACTIPWKVMKQLAQNHFTDIGTQQFFEHTRLMTVTVGDVIRENRNTINEKSSVKEALIEMTKSKLGAITLVDDSQSIRGIFTDGDLRRLLETKGEGALDTILAELSNNDDPITIDSSALLYDASSIFKERKIDNIIVTNNGTPVGMLDIQDMIE